MKNLKEIQRNYIVSRSLSVFLKNSIESVTIADLAKEVELGEATLYRYFGKKINLVLECGEMLMENLYSASSEVNFDRGYDAIVYFYETFLKVFKENKRVFSFISELDAYVLISDGVDSDAYQGSLDMYKSYFMRNYQKGLDDGSILKLQDPTTFFYASTHALLELCKKCALDKDIVAQDETIDRSGEIQMLIDMILAYLKEENA